MALAVASKTLAESVVLGGTGTAWGQIASPGLNVLTILIVVAFLLSAAVMWRRGLLKEFSQTKSAGTRVSIVFSIPVWLAVATIPYWY